MRQEMLMKLWIEQKPEMVKRVVVPNARILEELAAAGRLDTLIQPDAVVVIPDVVRATNGIKVGGDRKVLLWIMNHERDGSVYVGSTKVWENFVESRVLADCSEAKATREIVERLIGQGEMVEIL